MASTVNIALAGIGGYGASYVDALLDDPRSKDTRLLAVADPAAERSPRFAELRGRGCRVFPDAEELLDAVGDDLDLFVIAAPTQFHASLTCAAVRRGINVLCEKPLAGSLADALEVVSLARSVDGSSFVAIGYQWSFSDAVQQLKRDVLSGALGRPLRMRALACYPRGVAYFTRNDWSGRIRTPGGHAVNDSPVNNATAHFLHHMLYLLGPTRETSAMPGTVQAELYRANDIQNYDTAAMRCTTAGGAEVLFYTTHAEAERIGPRCLLEFEGATIEYDMHVGARFVARFADGRVRVYGDPDADRRLPLWQSVAAVRGDDAAPVACDALAALPQTVCMAAAQEFPVVDLPTSLHRTAQAGEGRMIAIHGLGEAFVACYARGVLPGEHNGLTWARAARPQAVVASQARHNGSFPVRQAEGAAQRSPGSDLQVGAVS